MSVRGKPNRLGRRPASFQYRPAIVCGDLTDESSEGADRRSFKHRPAVIQFRGERRGARSVTIAE